MPRANRYFQPNDLCISKAEESFALQESTRSYEALFESENEALRPENTLYWKESLESTEA